MSTTSEIETTLDLSGRRVGFVGKLGGVTRKEAFQLVRDLGGVPLEQLTAQVDLIVIGADQFPLDDISLLDESIREAAGAGSIEVLDETEMWQRLGMVEPESNVRQLYTPAMLAELLGVSVAVIRRWHRRKLIMPAREVHRLPYFDFTEVATAQRLAQLVAAGASPRAIEKKLEQLARFVPGVERPLAQLSVIVEGRQLLLRQGEGLVEPGGQLRIDFAALEEAEVEPASAEVHAPEGNILSFPDSDDSLENGSPDDLVARAALLEDEGRLSEAIDTYRTALAFGGPRPEVCFHLAEALYRSGDVSAARERYYMAIELDEEYVEARANLGCVLAETGQDILAIAAFEGVLRYHDDYPDAHYHLARALDRQQQPDEAEYHWRRFLTLSPGSPWADEARDRVGIS